MSFANPDIQFVEPLTDHSLERLADALPIPLTLSTPEVELALSQVEPP